MSYVVDYSLNDPARKWAMLALFIEDRKCQKSMDIIHIQKVIRYFEYLRNTEELDYSNFKLGAVSYELEQNLTELVESGLIDETDETYVLTSDGEEIAEAMMKDFDSRECKKLVFSKQQLNDLSSDELMYFMYRVLPSSQENSTEIARLEKKRVVIVRSLFLKGRINATIAAKWLGISEKDFLDSLSSHN